MVATAVEVAKRYTGCIRKYPYGAPKGNQNNLIHEAYRDMNF